jgi:hypothetical protein
MSYRFFDNTFFSSGSNVSGGDAFLHEIRLTRLEIAMEILKARGALAIWPKHMHVEAIKDAFVLADLVLEIGGTPPGELVAGKKEK